MEDIILKFQDIDSYGAHLVAKHFVVFIFFFISGIFVYLITSKIIKNIFFCSFVTILYLFYPYLLGHGLFNPKDIPFLTIWIVCTYVSINILTKLSNQIYLKYKDIIYKNCVSYTELGPLPVCAIDTKGKNKYGICPEGAVQMEPEENTNNGKFYNKIPKKRNRLFIKRKKQEVNNNLYD